MKFSGDFTSIKKKKAKLSLRAYLGAVIEHLSNGAGMTAEHDPKFWTGMMLFSLFGFLLCFCLRLLFFMFLFESIFMFPVVFLFA